jgi:hypothetical protein
MDGGLPLKLSKAALMKPQKTGRVAARSVFLRYLRQAPSQALLRRRVLFPIANDEAEEVTMEFVGAPEGWSRLGHDLRVIVHVTVWKSDDALTVPTGALFRKGENWAVFVVRDGRTRTVAVQPGHRNNRQTEVLSGLSSGDLVVLHPSDRVVDGARVVQRGSQ